MKLIQTLLFVVLFVIKSMAIPFPLTTCKDNSDIFAGSDISGIIWYDLNMDGMKDDDESPMQNIPVLLYTCDGTFVSSILSQANGSYSFINIPDGNYKIFVSLATLGSDYNYTLLSSSTDNKLNFYGFTECFSMTKSSYTFDGGITAFPYLGDKVWEDINGNGIQDAGEPGIANVDVEIYNASGLVAITTTNNYGIYTFNTIFPGQYYIKFITPDEYLPTKHIQGITGNSAITNGNGQRTTDYFEVAPQVSNFGLDGGFYRCAKICGIVYNDINYSDSLNTNENGINGIKINLYQISETDTILWSSTYTGHKPASPSDDGYYEFCVIPGQYYIEIENVSLPNYFPGLAFKTNNPFTYNHFTEVDGKMVSYTITLYSDDSYCYINQGYYCLSKVQSIVWFDTNNNGIRDIGEPLLSNIPARLYNKTNDLIATGVSNENGLIIFNKLKKGTYYIVFEIDESHSYTIPFNGASDKDSNVDGTYGTGSTPWFIVGDCAVVSGIDAGIILKPLPVKWVEIYAEKYPKYNKIYWKIAQEENVSHYLVMKSPDGRSWHVCDKTTAVADAQIYTYESTDFNIESIKTYYKIQSVDFDGKVSNSNLIYVYRNEDGIFKVHPNPADKQIVISSPAQTVDFKELQFDVLNSMGQIIHSGLLNINSSATLEVGNWPEGIYQVILRNQQEIINVKKISIIH
jgi:hypothetical protein